MDMIQELDTLPVLQPARSIEALLNESKRLQVTSLQLIRASNELQTMLVLLVHQQRHLQKQWMKHSDLLCLIVTKQRVYYS